MVFSGALVPTAVLAQTDECPRESQRIDAVRFLGNDVTQGKVLRREMTVKPGGYANSKGLLADVMRIKDLGLFREVSVSCQREDGLLVAEFQMREKYFLWLTPRANGNSDGDYSYGLHLSWHNAFGLNHTWRGTLQNRRSTQAGRGDSFEYRLANTMPFIWDTPYTATWGFAHETESLSPVGAEELSYDQSDDRGFVGLSKHYSHGAASQGLTLGWRYEYRTRKAQNTAAGPNLGTGHTLSLEMNHRQRHDHVYSDSGHQANLVLSRADRAWGSDYNQSNLKASYSMDWHVGSTAHQTIGVHAETEIQAGGPQDGLNQYSLGGASLLRGYERNSVEGDAYALVRLEAFRPLHWRWLRWGGFVEAGGAWGGDETTNAGLLLSTGLGLQIRPSWFVGVVIDLGIGIPLISTDQTQSLNFYGAGR